VNNGVGDTIYALIRIDRWGSDGFHFTTGASGGEAWNWMSEAAWDGGPDTMPFYIVANVPNVTLWSDVWGGSSSGWRAHFEVFQVVPAPRTLTALDPVTKDRAQWWSDSAQEAVNVSAGIVVTLGGASMIPVYGTVVKPFAWLFTGIGVTSGYLKQRFDRYVRDPAVPCPGECDVPYNPELQSPQALGLSYCDPDGDPDGTVTSYCNWFVDLTAAMDQQFDGATASIDRETSCLELAAQGLDLGCEWWQRDRIAWFSWNAGYILTDYANGLHEIGNVAINYGLGDYGQWLHNLADSYGRIAGTLQEVNQ
jgi:hypothetical protein